MRFEKPQRAVTPGQAIVFYQDEELLGGGIIETTEPPNSPGGARAATARRSPAFAGVDNGKPRSEQAKPIGESAWTSGR